MKDKNRMNFCILLLLLACSCHHNGDSQLFGNWSVNKVEYLQYDISGIDRSGIVMFTKPMSFDKRGNIWMIEINSKRIYSKFKILDKNHNKYVSVPKCVDPRLSGLYLITIKEETEKNVGPVRYFTLELRSETTYIYAEKQVTTIFTKPPTTK